MSIPSYHNNIFEHLDNLSKELDTIEKRGFKKGILLKTRKGDVYPEEFSSRFKLMLSYWKSKFDHRNDKEFKTSIETSKDRKELFNKLSGELEKISKEFEKVANPPSNSSTSEFIQAANIINVYDTIKITGKINEISKKVNNIKQKIHSTKNAFIKKNDPIQNLNDNWNKAKPIIENYQILYYHFDELQKEIDNIKSDTVENAVLKNGGFFEKSNKIISRLNTVSTFLLKMSNQISDVDIRKYYNKINEYQKNLYNQLNNSFTTYIQKATEDLKLISVTSETDLKTIQVNIEKLESNRRNFATIMTKIKGWKEESPQLYENFSKNCQEMSQLINNKSSEIEEVLSKRLHQLNTQKKRSQKTIKENKAKKDQIINSRELATLIEKIPVFEKNQEENPFQKEKDLSKDCLDLLKAFSKYIDPIRAEDKKEQSSIIDRLATKLELPNIKEPIKFVDALLSQIEKLKNLLSEEMETSKTVTSDPVIKEKQTDLINQAMLQLKSMTNITMRNKLNSGNVKSPNFGIAFSATRISQTISTAQEYVASLQKELINDKQEKVAIENKKPGKFSFENKDKKLKKNQLKIEKDIADIGEAENFLKALIKLAKKYEDDADIKAKQQKEITLQNEKEKQSESINNRNAQIKTALEEGEKVLNSFKAIQNVVINETEELTKINGIDKQIESLENEIFLTNAIIEKLKINSKEGGLPIPHSS